MTTTLDKLVFLIINRFMNDTNALSVEDFALLFEENPSLRTHLCESYLEMPVLDNSNREAVLLIPAINILMMVIRDKGLVDYFFNELKDTIQPFKEVYYLEDNKKHILHGLDLFNIVGRYIAAIRDITHKFIEDIKTQQSLNIKSVHQYFSCIHKHRYLLQSYHFDKHVNFEVGFESLFLKNWDYELNKSNARAIKFDPIKNPHIPLHGVMNIELRNINEANDEEMKKIIELIQYNILNSRKNFSWNEEKLSTLLASNSNIIDGSDKVLLNLLQTIVSEGMSINKNVLSLLFVKNKKVFNEFMEFLKDNKVIIYEENEDMSEDKKDQFILELEKIQKVVNDYEQTDIKVVTICADILKSLELFNSEKALAYFSEDIEAKFNLESIAHKYIPNILDTYFNLPEKIRNDSNRDFQSITIEQLTKINEKLKNIEYDILEKEMKKMKIFGSFLESRFNS